MKRNKVEARIVLGHRKKLSESWGGGYDPNVVVLAFQITDGPASFIDRQISSEVSMSELVDAMPEEFTERLRCFLNELFEAR